LCKQITVAVVNPEEDCLYTDDDSESENGPRRHKVSSEISEHEAPKLNLQT